VSVTLPFAPLAQALAWSQLYTRDVLHTEDSIPVFCEHDFDGYIANYEQIAADHLDHIATGGCNPWQPEAYLLAMEGATASIIGKYALPGDRILDVGVCLGRLLALLPDLDRYGIDISVPYLQAARSEGIEVALARAEDLPYPDGFFNIVACTDVLEHVLDLHQSVSECLRVLRPGGTLVVRVPQEDDLAAYLADDFPYRFVHLRRFDVPTLRLLFGRVFVAEILMIAELSAASEGTSGREIVVAIRKPPA